MKRTIENRNVRKLYKHSSSYAVTVPVEMIRALRWQERQKVVFKRQGKKIIIEDWKK